MRLRHVVIPAAIATAAGGVAAGVAGMYAVRRLARVLVRPRVDLHGKVVLITGGSRGLGLALAKEFAKAGARVAICARDAQELDEAERRLHGISHDVVPFVCDVTRREDI